MAEKPVTDDRELYGRLKKRMIMFYFAAGLNLVMALWVMSVGAGQAAGGTLWIVTLIFLVFAGLNFYMARRLRNYWAAHVRSRSQSPDGE